MKKNIDATIKFRYEESKSHKLKFSLIFLIKLPELFRTIPIFLLRVLIFFISKTTAI